MFTGICWKYIKHSSTFVSDWGAEYLPTYTMCQNKLNTTKPFNFEITERPFVVKQTYYEKIYKVNLNVANKQESHLKLRCKNISTSNAEQICLYELGRTSKFVRNK